ncbi:MAG: NUDIX domain-containing protein [bacterium]|nr:NUDIX domain-containing protein [bacterium]
MKTNFKLTIFNHDDSPPPDELVSAVFLIPFDSSGKILCCHNQRGWDIVGGHVEQGESFKKALKREVLEEGGATFDSAIPFATISSSTSKKVMLCYVSNKFTLQNFKPSGNDLERDVLSTEELISRYQGDKKLLRNLLDGAKKCLKNLRA